MVRCPKCSQDIIKAYPSGKAKMRAQIVVARTDGTMFAVCTKCKSEVDVPMKLTEPVPEVAGGLYIKK